MRDPRAARRRTLLAELQARLADTGDSPVANDVMADLRRRMAEWRDVLQTTDPAGVATANRLIRQLLVGRLVLHPEDDHYRFQGTLQPILAGSLSSVV